MKNKLFFWQKKKTPNPQNVAEQDNPPGTAGDSGEIPPVKTSYLTVLKKYQLPLTIGAALILVCIVLCSILFSPPVATPVEIRLEPRTDTFLDTQGNLYLLDAEHSFSKKASGIKRATADSDASVYAYIDGQGDLFVVHTDTNASTHLASDVFNLHTLTDTYIIFSRKADPNSTEDVPEQLDYYTTLENPQPILLQKSGESYVDTDYFDDTSAFLYVSDGILYALTPGSQPQELAAVSETNETYLVGGTPTASMAVWLEVSTVEDDYDPLYTVYLYNSGNVSRLYSFHATFDSSNYFYHTPSVYCNEAGDALTIFSPNDTDYIYYVEKGKEPQRILLPGTLYCNYPYTQSTAIWDRETLESPAGHYFIVYDFEQTVSRLCLIGSDMQAKVIYEFGENIPTEICGGKIFYRGTSEENMALFYYDLNGTSVSSTKRIADNVSTYRICNNGNTVYYTTYDYVLYRWEQGRAPERIASNVKFLDFLCSPDGKSVLYFSETSTLLEYRDIGDLYIKQEGKPEQKLGSDVTSYSSIARNDSFDYFNPNDLYFLCNTTVSGDSTIAELWKYDGSTTTLLAKDIPTYQLY